jgi:hypothetical protein
MKGLFPWSFARGHLRSGDILTGARSYSPGFRPRRLTRPSIRLHGRGQDREGLFTIHFGRNTCADITGRRDVFAPKARRDWQVACRRDNDAMTIFYWAMGILIVGTFVPSALYLVLYLVTGRDTCIRRARVLWNLSRVFALVGVDVLIWGRVVVALWQIWFS